MTLVNLLVFTTCITSIAIHDKGYMLRDWPSSEDAKYAFLRLGENFCVDPSEATPDNHKEGIGQVVA